MDDVAGGGRTVLFVSHNMAAVDRLASSVIWLDHGRVMSIGAPRETIAKYLGGDRRSRYAAEGGSDKPQVLHADIEDASGRAVSRLLNTDRVVVRLRYALPRRMAGTVVGIGVLSADGVPLFTSNTNDVEATLPQEAGEHEVAVTIPSDVLLVGDYHVAICLWDRARSTICRSRRSRSRSSTVRRFSMPARRTERASSTSRARGRSASRRSPDRSDAGAPPDSFRPSSGTRPRDRTQRRAGDDAPHPR